MLDSLGDVFRGCTQGYRGEIGFSGGAKARTKYEGLIYDEYT